MHKLTKTDFKYYLDCPESLWLLKNNPSVYPKGEFSLFAEKLVKEGYEVEHYAKQLFPNGRGFSDNADPKIVKSIINSGVNNVFFQPSFSTSNNIYARVDILERLPNGTFHLYEVKSSTRVKTKRKYRHIEDVCFQKYVLAQNGYNVSKVSIILLDKNYIRKGNVIAKDLLKIEDVTAKVNSIYNAVSIEINLASAYINRKSINQTACSCLYKTRSNHCDSFAYFNKNIPDFSIYEIGNIREGKIKLLKDVLKILKIDEIPSGFNLTNNQEMQVDSVKIMKPVLNIASIKSQLSTLKFPLHFIDYETYPTAIPKKDGMSPHKHLVFQVSIHTLSKNGSLTHFEYLLDDYKMPVDMLVEMEKFTGSTGTFISWHASFERDRNKDLIIWLPQFKKYLEYINEHTFDLEPIFKSGYVDYRFHGYSSIKKVLPVIVPNLTYSNLPISDGTMALDTWGRMIFDKDFDEDIETTKSNLLKYCKLDTFAMVEIYQELKKIK